MASTNITINIVEPGTPPSLAPVDPGIDPSVPNTGLFTYGIGGPEATIIVGIIVAIIILAILAILSYRRYKKTGKVTKLVRIASQCKTIIKSKKRITAGLAALALLVSAGTFMTLAKNGVNATDTDGQAEDEESLTVNVNNSDLTIEVGDAPVFAVLPVDVTVEQATQAGYTLTAFADSTDLVSTTDSSKVIPMITIDEGELAALTDNAYGLALGEEPTTKDAEVYMSLSIDSDNPTIIKSMPEYTPTEENDTTTIYYGFYITPDIPYGTYTNDSEVYYNATINTTPVTFDGNGLYFNEDEQQTTNEVEYVAVPEEGKEYNVNQIISGEYKTPSQDLPYNFLGWSTDPTATVPTYETEEKIAEFLPISPNTPITLYAVWQKATTITYDSNGGTGDIDTQTIIAGESDSLYKNTFVKDGYTFTGWNTVAGPTEQEPGKSYTDEAVYQAGAESANVTLFAQWEKMPVIGNLTYMQDFATLSETGKTSVLNSMTAGEQYQLKDSRDQKDYYISKLADGNVWMTQNLDHNIGDIKGGTYTSVDTDIFADWVPDSNNYTKQTSDKAWDWDYSLYAPASYDPGDLYWNGAFLYGRESCEENGGIWVSVTSHDYCNGGFVTSSGDSHYHVGNYYNWTAAVAMDNSSAYTTNYQYIDQSICPAGWRLPAYNGDKSYQNLESAQNLTDGGVTGNIHNDPVYFVYGSDWSGGIFENFAGYGGYWSNRVIIKNQYLKDNIGQLSLSVNQGVLQGSGGRRSGYSLRCVTR